jgi:quinol monooxygenase YgiN
MTAALIVKHRVADFAQWKKVFDSMIPVRKQHGWLGHTVLRDAQDPNVVTIVNRVKDLDGAKRYGASAEMKNAMKEAGVQGAPEISFLESADDLTY